jgi:hypothetical protein
MLNWPYHAQCQNVVRTTRTAALARSPCHPPMHQARSCSSRAIVRSVIRREIRMSKLSNYRAWIVVWQGRFHQDAGRFHKVQLCRPELDAVIELSE